MLRRIRRASVEAYGSDPQ